MCHLCASILFTLPSVALFVTQLPRSRFAPWETCSQSSRCQLSQLFRTITPLRTTRPNMSTALNFIITTGLRGTPYITAANIDLPSSLDLTGCAKNCLTTRYGLAARDLPRFTALVKSPKSFRCKSLPMQRSHVQYANEEISLLHRQLSSFKNELHLMKYHLAVSLEHCELQALLMSAKPWGFKARLNLMSTSYLCREIALEEWVRYISTVELWLTEDTKRRLLKQLEEFRVR